MNSEGTGSCDCSKLGKMIQGLRNRWGWGPLDPRLAGGYSKLSVRAKCMAVMAFHQTLVQNLLSFFNPVITKRTPELEDIFPSHHKELLEDFEESMPKRFALTKVGHSSFFASNMF